MAGWPRSLVAAGCRGWGACTSQWNIDPVLPQTATGQWGEEGGTGRVSRTPPVPSCRAGIKTSFVRTRILISQAEQPRTRPHSFMAETRQSVPLQGEKNWTQEPTDNYTSSEPSFYPAVSMREISRASSYKCLVVRCGQRSDHRAPFQPGYLYGRWSPVIEGFLTVFLVLAASRQKITMICLSLLKRQSLSSFHLWSQGTIMIMLW